MGEKPTDWPILLIAAHGERAGDMENSRLARIAAIAGEELRGVEVRHGVLSGEPSIEDAIGDAAGRQVAVYPFFMADGYFSRMALPKRLAALGINAEMLDVFGSDPHLPSLTATLVRNAVAAPPAVLVVAHGSTKSTSSRDATEAFAAALGGEPDMSNISCAYLEEVPFADAAIAALPQGAALVNHFNGDGLHGGADVPRILRDSGRYDISLVTPAAHRPAVAHMIARAARQHFAGLAR